MEPETEIADTARVELGHEFIRYHRVIHTLRTQMADVLPSGLDPAAAQLLAWLVKQGPSRQGELAEHTFLDPSTISRRISQLVHLGLVERRADAVDGRAVQLVPTAHGQACFNTMSQRRQEIMQQVLSGWTSTEVAALSGLLRKFNDDFETYRSQSNAPISTAPIFSAPISTAPTTAAPTTAHSPPPD